MLNPIRKRFVHRESYKHLLAKKLLISWLRELDENQDGCSFGKLSWRSNYGVHEELPFYETSDNFYFELSKGLIEGIHQKHRVYEFKTLFHKGYNFGKILFVPDITIFHKGSPLHLIEVVHTSEPNSLKLSNIQYFFHKKGGNPNIWIIKAEHILCQINKPASLNFELLTY